MNEMMIEVPADLARSLTEEGIAEETGELEPGTWKAGPDTISVLTLVVDATAAATSLIVSRDSITEFAKSFVGKLSRKHKSVPELTVTVKVNGTSTVLIEANDDEGHRRLSARIEMAAQTALKK